MVGIVIFAISTAPSAKFPTWEVCDVIYAEEVDFLRGVGVEAQVVIAHYRVAIADAYLFVRQIQG